VAVVGEVECPLEVLFDECPLVIACRLLRVELGDPVGDALLFMFEQVKRDGSGVVGLEEFCPFLDQASPLRLKLGTFPAGFDVVRVECCSRATFDLFSMRAGQFDGCVVIFDEFFNSVDENGAHLAVRAFLVSADADEIGVDPRSAGATLGVRDDHAAFAVPAEDSFEVVRVHAFLLPDRFSRA